MSVSVCLCVCLSASISFEMHVQSSSNFSMHLTMAVARFSSCDVAIRYVLPVLRMTSYGGMPIPLQQVTLLRHRAHANAPAASYWLTTEGAETRQSIMKGLPGAEPAMHHCLVLRESFVTNVVDSSYQL